MSAWPMAAPDRSADAHGGRWGRSHPGPTRLTDGAHTVVLTLEPPSGQIEVHRMHASIHRAALAVSGLAVVTVVGGFLIADGYLAARGQAAGGPATATVDGPLASTAAAA